ncbi:MAG: NADH-quinone oxidoreductase subunit A [Chloroflexi bacterium]|nr:NADH-quinone oxidoreductase subunit A [Chloroflexota bacterium]
MPTSILIWPIVVYGGIAVFLIAAMIVLSYLLGERHGAPARNQPYESGIEPTGSARGRYGAKYYLVGIFFIVFDVEAAIIFAWAVAFRELGWAGYTTAALFIVTLTVGLVYIWKLRGLDWSADYTRRVGGDRE